MVSKTQWQYLFVTETFICQKHKTELFQTDPFLPHIGLLLEDATIFKVIG